MNKAVKLALLAVLLAGLVAPFAPGGPLQSVHAEPLAAWQTNTNYPINIGANRCVTAVPGPTDQPFIYCSMGFTGAASTTNSYFGVIPLDTTPTIPSWFSTTANSLDSNPFHGWCGAYQLLMLCIGANVISGATEWAPLSNSGIGTWQSGGNLPTGYFLASYQNGCVVYGIYVYCVLENDGSGNTPYIFSTTVQSLQDIDGSGTIWSNQGLVSGANLAQIYNACVVVVTTGPNPFLTCVAGTGPASAPENNVYDAQISNGIVGTWTKQTNYPNSVNSATCWSVITSYIDCIGGSTGTGASTHGYYGLMDSSGRITWTATTNYAGMGTQSYIPCTAFVFAGAAYAFCAPGIATGGGGGTTNVIQYTNTAAIASTFTAIITNFDAGNYLIAGNGKQYVFQAQVSSNAISATNAAILNVSLTFNDSLHIFTVSYNNQTKTFAQNAKSASYIIMTGGTVTSVYQSGIRLITVNWLVSLTSNVLDASNRDLTLYGQNVNLQSLSQVVQENYYNILNKGGGISIITSGLCSLPSGADTFQAQCKYQLSPTSFIHENVTYADLQQYSGLFSLQLQDGSTTLQGDGLLWQNYANSGAGANNSTNPGDWTVTMGLYYWDNTTWVKGINVELSTNQGRQGTANQWTQFTADWKNGATFIANQTFNAWIEQTPLGQTSLWVNLWYSTNNASTTEGGRISSYYTGMHNSGFLWWSSWSPFLQNDTLSQIFMTTKDHGGKVMNDAGITFSKVFFNMARPGANGVHAKQPNFTIDSRNFQLDNFGIAPGAMSAITTPAYTPAVVPIIQNTGFFAPIVHMLENLAGLIAGALTYVGTLVWASLGSRFPWFTGYLQLVYSTIASFYLFLFAVINDVIGAVKFIYTTVSLLAYPVNVIISAWGTITGIFGPIFTGANLSAIIELAVLWIFAGFIIEKADKNDTRGFVELASGAWRVVNTVFEITWMIAKFIVDSIEGLIP